jgi:hypothetical protein
MKILNIFSKALTDHGQMLEINYFFHIPMHPLHITIHATLAAHELFEIQHYTNSRKKPPL